MKNDYWKWTLIIFGCVFIYRFVDKDSLIQVINQSLPSTEAGILDGMLLGDKSGIDKGFYKNLQNSGLVHLVIVSGTNVMLIVGGLIEISAQYFGRKKTIVMGIILGWGYAAMVGWEIPVIRAMLMLSIMYWAQLLGRKFDVYRGLGLAVIIMFIGDMHILTSVSFWLSVMAYLAVITSKKFLISNIKFLKKRKIMIETINTIVPTIWVSLWITPILAMVFGKISIVSPLTNLLVLGVVEVITLIGAIGSLAGLMVPLLGKYILWLVYPLLKYFGEVVMLSGDSSMTMAVSFNWWMLIGWYLILFYFLIKNKTKNI